MLRDASVAPSTKTHQPGAGFGTQILATSGSQSSLVPTACLVFSVTPVSGALEYRPHTPWLPSGQLVSDPRTNPSLGCLLVETTAASSQVFYFLRKMGLSLSFLRPLNKG